MSRRCRAVSRCVETLPTGQKSRNHVEVQRSMISAHRAVLYSWSFKFKVRIWDSAVNSLAKIFVQVWHSRSLLLATLVFSVHCSTKPHPTSHFISHFFLQLQNVKMGQLRQSQWSQIVAREVIQVCTMSPSRCFVRCSLNILPNFDSR